MNTLTLIPLSNPCLSFYWYCANLTSAISLHSSAKSRSRDSNHSLLPLRSWSDLNAGKPVSVGITASNLYVMENRVSPIDLLGVMRYVHKTWGNLSTHFPLASSNLFFNPSTMTLLVASTCPLLCGYEGVEYLFLSLSHNSTSKRLYYQIEAHYFVCCHCKLKAEDGYHALWDCSELSAIWETDVMWLFCRSKKFSNFFELARFVLENDKQPEQFATITWTIWFRRNQLRTSNKPFPLSQIIPSARQLLQEFNEVHPAAPAQNSTPQQSRPKWEPPPPSLLKINFDGVVFREIEEAGLGVVVRDSHCQVLASLAEKIKLPSCSDEVEALAAVRAITLAMDLNLPSFIVEGDSEVVISALRSEEDSFSSFGHLISSVKHYLVSCNCVSFMHIRRSGNSVAHFLAKHAKTIDGFSV